MRDLGYVEGQNWTFESRYAWRKDGSSAWLLRSSGSKVKRLCAPIWRIGQTDLLAQRRKRFARRCFGTPTPRPRRPRRGGTHPSPENDEARGRRGREDVSRELKAARPKIGRGTSGRPLPHCPVRWAGRTGQRVNATPG